MDISRDNIDENIEIKLLINFSLNEVFNLPHNIYNILDGKYEDILNNENSAFIINEINNIVTLEEIVHKNISETDTYSSWLCTGIASLLYFVQNNFTGPYIKKDIDWLKIRRNEALKSLSLHDECNINIEKPELLHLSKMIFSNTDLRLNCRSCTWWLFRANLLHQYVLNESSGVIFEETENLISQISDLDILKDPLCKVLFNLEVARFYMCYRRVQNSEVYLDQAQSIACLTLHLKGAMGKRTRYQQVEKAQLRLKAKMSKDIFPTVDCNDVPRSVDLNDEVRLEHIKFSEQEEEIKLGAVEEAVILAKYAQLQLCQPKHKLTDEEIEPYLNWVIDSTKNWSLKVAALSCRCSLEHDNKRTIMRSMMQAQSLMKEYSDSKAFLARRMDLFFVSGMKPIWTLEEKLAHVMCKLGQVKEALEIYTTLSLWEEVITCYCLLGLQHKAAEIIRQELARKPTVKLWCLLGDTTKDMNHYQTAWKLSNERSSRAQRHWGYFYFERKDYSNAVPHLKLSVELNNIQEKVWLRLGYSALQINDWKLAATAYRRYCAFEPYNFEAWNNLAKAYIKLGEKPKAWKCLQDAVKCNYDRWEVWDNFMVVSVDLGHFSQVIHCYHRILDLKNRHLDVQILQILTKAIINDINDSDGNPASRLLQKSLELFGRLASIHNSDTWRMYAQLVALKKTDADEEKAAQYVQQAYRAATLNPSWSLSEEKTLNMLELCCDLAQIYLRCTTDAVDKKRKMLGSAKLSLQGIVKEVKKQEWSNLNIVEQLTKVEEYLAVIVGNLDQIKPT